MAMDRMMRVGVIAVLLSAAAGSSGCEHMNNTEKGAGIGGALALGRAWRLGQPRETRERALRSAASWAPGPARSSATTWTARRNAIATSSRPSPPPMPRLSNSAWA